MNGLLRIFERAIVAIGEPADELALSLHQYRCIEHPAEAEAPHRLAWPGTEDEVDRLSR